MNLNNMIESLNKKIIEGAKMTQHRFKLFSLIILSAIFLTSCSNLDIQTLNLKAKQLIDSGDIDGAIGRLESINDLNLGIAYNKKGEFDKAIKSLNEATKLNPKFADAYYSLAVIYENMALTIIEESSKEKKLAIDSVTKILENLKYSHESYAKYLTLTQNSSEKESIQVKLESLNNDISKYQDIFIENSPAEQ